MLLIKPEYISFLGPTASQNVYTAIQTTTKNIPLEILMATSGVFGTGFGRKKFKAILDVYPNLLEEQAVIQNDVGTMEAAFLRVPGFKEGALKVAQGMSKFRAFLEEMRAVGFDADQYKASRRQLIVAKAPVIANHPLNGINIVSSGFRTNNSTVTIPGTGLTNLKAFIESVGGNVQDSVTRTTNMLIIADSSMNTGKVKAAEAKGVTVITKADFIRNYLPVGSI